jgi:hypothetical protein
VKTTTNDREIAYTIDGENLSLVDRDSNDHTNNSSDRNGNISES